MINKLNSLVTTRTIVAAVALSMWAEMPSGPLAFVTSNDVRWEKTSSSYRGVAQDRHLGLLQLTVYISRR